MDKQTLSNYGWIVICILVLSVMLALATPFGTFCANGFKATYTGFEYTGNKALKTVLPGGGNDDGGNTPDTPDVPTYKRQVFTLGNLNFTQEAHINDDGSIDNRELVLSSWLRSQNPYEPATSDEWAYTSESNYNNLIKKCFDVSDSKLASIKAQKTFSHENGAVKVEYKDDGTVGFHWLGMGDTPSYSHDVVGMVIDNANSFTVYHDYSTTDYGNFDTVEHKYYYAVNYKYSGTGSITIQKGLNGYDYIVSDNTALISSLKVVSAKKVSSLPSGLTTPTQEVCNHTNRSAWLPLTYGAFYNEDGIDMIVHIRECENASCGESFVQKHTWTVKNGKTVCSVCGAIKESRVNYDDVFASFPENEMSYNDYSELVYNDDTMMSKVLFLTVPDGAEFETQGTVYTAGQEVKGKVDFSDGDKYTYDNYIYTYSWDSSISSFVWNATVKDASQTSVGGKLSTLFNITVK